MIKFNNFYNQTKQNDLQLNVFGISEAGHKRTTNEDAFLISNINDSNKLLAVADGFSGFCGEEASRLAVNELRELLTMPSAWNIAQRLRTAITIVSQKIGRHFEKSRRGASVGTTLTAAYIVDETAYIAHVGNSRAYLLRNGKIRQLTTDQTFAQVLINQGAKPSEASKKTLLQALGVECELAPTVTQIELLPNDYLLLCSDGFSNALDAAEIAEMIEANADISIAVERLIETANVRDGSDNITVVLAHASRVVSATESFQMITLKPIAGRMAT
jgi:PPM family protein phosphatase